MMTSLWSVTPLANRPAKNFSISAGPVATLWVGGSSLAFARYAEATASPSPLLNAVSHAVYADATSLFTSANAEAVATASKDKVNDVARAKRIVFLPLHR